MNNKFLETKNISKTFGKLKALDDVNFNLIPRQNPWFTWGKWCWKIIINEYTFGNLSA